MPVPTHPSSPERGAWGPYQTPLGALRVYLIDPLVVATRGSQPFVPRMRPAYLFNCPGGLYAPRPLTPRPGPVILRISRPFAPRGLCPGLIPKESPEIYYQNASYPSARRTPQGPNAGAQPPPRGHY